MQTSTQGEDKGRILFEIASVAMLVAEGEGLRILDANPAALDLYGYTRPEFLALTLADVSAEPEQVWRTLAAEQGVLSLSRCYQRQRGGATFPADISARRFAWQGQPAYLVVVHDVSDHVHSEEALRRAQLELEVHIRARTAELMSINQAMQAEIEARRQAEASLRRMYIELEEKVLARTAELAETNRALREVQRQQQALLDGIPDLAWLKDRESRFIAVNQPMAQACGLPREQMIGKTDFDVWPRELAERYRADDAEVMRSGQMKRVEEPLLNSQGQLSYIETIKIPILDEQGQVIGTAGIARDVAERRRAQEALQQARDTLETHVQERTAELLRMNQALHAEIAERRRAEEALREGRNFLQTMIDHLPVSVFVKTPDGRFVLWNKSAEQLFGASREAILGKTDYDFFSKEQADFFRQKDLETLESGKVQDILEEPVDSISLGRRWLHTVKVPIYDARGVPQYLLGISQDITDRKRAEEEKADLQAQLLQAQKMEAVGRLTAGIAHDFNNLLTAINGFSELIRSQLRPEDPLCEPVDQVLSAGQRAAHLVRQLMAFSRKEASRAQVIDVNSVVGDLNQMLRRTIGEDIHLELRLAPQLWPVSIDPTHLDQLIINLVVNARDAMVGGGRLTIETFNVVLDEAYAARHLEVQPGEYVQLIISDTGVGMSDEVKAHLFEPFFTTKGAGRGTGLGLATVYSIVKQSGGHIWVESQEGVGTTFRIYLPRAWQVASPLHHSPVREAPRRGQETILLAEDHEGVRDMARRVLENAGYTVLTACNGQEALQLANSYEGTIHLLLTDVVMPDLSGKALAEQLTQTRTGLRVLFMSGYTDNTIVHHGVLDDGVTLLPKPFGPAELARKVREVMDASP